MGGQLSHLPRPLLHDATPADRREAHRAKMARKKAERRAAVDRANAQQAATAALPKPLDLSPQSIAEGEQQDRAEAFRELMHAAVAVGAMMGIRNGR